MKVCIYNWNGVLDGLPRAIGSDLTQDWLQADTLVMWQDVMGEMENIATKAKMMGKKVIVAEHGLLSVNDYIPPLSHPLIADKIMVFGNWSKHWLVNKGGIDPNKVVVTGTLISKKKVERRKHDDIRVLFAPRHWDGDIQENLDVANELRKSKYNVFSKILAGENDPVNYPHPLSTDRQGLNHIETCFDVLSWANVVVGLGEGTFGALAHLMDIPYISVDNWQTKELLGKVYDREEFNSQISKAAIQINIESLNQTIEDVVKNPDINREDREWFRKEALNIGEDPLEKMLEVIYNE